MTKVKAFKCSQWSIKYVLNFQDIPNICFYSLWAIHPLICSLVLAFAMIVLGQVNTDAFNFSSIDLSKQSLLKSSANECQANPQKTVDDVNKQADFFIFRWDLPCSTFIFSEQPSLMAMAEVNRPLITLDYYGSKSCQSRLKTNSVFFVFAKVKM